MKTKNVSTEFNKNLEQEMTQLMSEVPEDLINKYALTEEEAQTYVNPWKSNDLKTGFKFSNKKFLELQQWATPENMKSLIELLNIIKNSEQE